MRSKTILIGSVLLSCVLLVTGCAKPPQAELDALKASVAGAESAQAETYSPSDLATARDAQAAAQAEIDAQAKKFALFRSYKKANELITDANAKAKAAQEAAVANKAKSKTDADAAVVAAKDAVTALQTALTELEACPRKPKGFSEDLAALKARAEGLSSQAAQLDSQISSEDYNGAKSTAESVSSGAATLTTDIQGAKEKLKC